MFQQLQDYLFQYKTVAIPGVGSFAVTEQPATLDVANQLLLPPSYAIRFSRHATVPLHQLQTLAAGFDNNIEIAENELARFSAALQLQLQQKPYDWQGIGALELSGTQLHFAPFDAPSMEALPAQRVLRENVAHTVLVGDQELRYTAEAYEASLAPERKRDWFLVIGWILAFVALMFLGYHLYRNNWAPGASGLQMKPEVGEMPRQYR